MKFPPFLKSQAPLVAILGAVFLAGWWFGAPANDSGNSGDEASGQAWTCSMHPQIRQPNPGICPICNMDLIVLRDDDDGGHRELNISSEAAALLDLRVSPVIREHATAEVQLFGRIAYDERRLSNITARMSGRLDRLYVDFTGVSIRKGNHLAEIYSPDLYVAQRELIEAKKGLSGLAPNASPASRRTRLSIYEGTREKLRLLQLTEEQINAIESQKEPSDHITLNSPQDGIVVTKLANEGQYVKTGDPIVGIADLTTVWLNLEAYESDLPWIRYAQDVAFTVEALPGQTFHGRIAFIAPDVDPVRRVARVRVTVPNPKLALKPGMFTRAVVRSSVSKGHRITDPALAGKWISPMHPEIVKDGPGQCDICGMDLVPAEELGIVSAAAGKNEPAPLLVPASAILHTGERAVTYVRLSAYPEPRFEGREIILGPRVGKRYVVESGLSEGELVVTRGTFKLDSELQIKARPSMMNRDAGLPESPAHEAEDSLKGQWGFIPRALARLSQASMENDRAMARNAIVEMKAAVAAVNTESFHPKTMRDWRESSNRLTNALTLALKQEAPSIAFRDLRDVVEEAGRFLGLPFQPATNSAPPAEAPLESLRVALRTYFAFSAALADDDETKALAEKPSLLAALESINEKPEALAKATEIVGLRKALQPITATLVNRIRGGAMDRVGNVYVVHCPMVDDYSGADWLSPAPRVLNPYFGDEMLTCGTVKEHLSFRSATAGKQPETKPSKKHNNHDH